MRLFMMNGAPLRYKAKYAAFRRLRSGDGVRSNIHAGDKLMEINVFSSGGLGSAQSFEGVNFTHAVVAALERKVQYMGFYQREFNNVDMATL